MVKTSVYLPDDLKDRLARAAELSSDSEATIIRSALEQWLASIVRPRSTMLGSIEWDPPDLPERVDVHDWIR